MNEFKFEAISDRGKWLTKGNIYTSKNGVITYDDGFEGCEYNSFKHWAKENPTMVGWVKEYIATNSESITIRRKKSKVIATLSIDGEFKYSQYIKLVDAGNDFKTAVKMVVERLLDKWDGGKGTDLTAEVLKVVKQDKYEVGDKVKIREDLAEIEDTKGAGVVEDMHCNAGKIATVTWLSKYGEFKLGLDVDDWIWSTDMIEGKLITPTITPPSPMGINRQVEVGEYIKITNGDRHFAKVGEVYKVEGHRMGFVEVETDKSMQLIKHNQYEVVENPIKKVKRPAKVGEWIEIVDANCGSSNNHYKNGDIMQIIKIEDEDRHFGEGAGEYLFDNEYLVLENYTPEVNPEVVEEIIAPSKFVKAKVGDKIRVVKVVNCHMPIVNDKDVYIVDEVMSSRIGTTSGNIFYDEKEEYTIVEDIVPEEPTNPLSAYTQEQLMKELFNRQGL